MPVKWNIQDSELASGYGNFGLLENEGETKKQGYNLSVAHLYVSCVLEQFNQAAAAAANESEIIWSLLRVMHGGISESQMPPDEPVGDK